MKQARQFDHRKEEIRRRLLGQLAQALTYLLPAGRFRGKKFYVGDIAGKPGESLTVELSGEKAGLWHDFATGDGGDIFALWAAVKGYALPQEFPRLMQEIESRIGLGDAPSDRWDYTDEDGKLVACVSRFDQKGKRKTYRPWDATKRTVGAPDKRLLYNLPAVIEAETIIFVEGEKAADALIEEGFCATTAMGGASAPFTKTDFSPLKGKNILIWPDHDGAGRAFGEKLLAHLPGTGTRQVALLQPPADKPDKWDAADAVAEGFDVAGFLKAAQPEPKKSRIPTFRVSDLLDDKRPMPADLISPRLLTPGGMMVFGGAPKVGKSDFLLSMLAHMAAGLSFLDFKPAGPMRVFYCQAEIGYHYLRERVRSLKLPKEAWELVRQNLVLTPQLHLVLNESGLKDLTAAIQTSFAKPPDILVIDPIRNLFDGGGDGLTENDNAAMLFFLRERIERLRRDINPAAGVILAHHTRKLPKKMFEEDPFQSLSGAGALRSFYSTGMLLYRPDENRSERLLIFELRNGPAIQSMKVDKKRGRWLVRGDHHPPTSPPTSPTMSVREAQAKLCDLIRAEAKEGRLYTSYQFASACAGRDGLGQKDTIRDRLRSLINAGSIRFIRDASDLGCKRGRSKHGLLCVEDMRFGEEEIPLKPTHFKCPDKGYQPVPSDLPWPKKPEKESV